MAGAQQPPAAPTGVGLALATTAGFIVASVIIFLILFIFVFLLCLRVNRCWGANPASGGSGGGDYVRPSVAAAAAAARQSGLDSAALKAIPWTVFRSEDLGDGAAECCAVCLSELSVGEAARRLPSCRHAFHRECIDMWFYSHATCPLCRSHAAAGAAAAATLDAPKQPGLAGEPSPRSPVCVLLSALQARASVNGDAGSQEGSPSSAGGGASPGRSEGEIMAMHLLNSPLMSLRRLLATGNRMVSSSPSSRSGDLEQGRLQPSPVQANSA